MSKQTTSNVDSMAPKPVHPRAIRFHGLFGLPYVRQHMIVDSRWTPACLTEQFRGITELLAKRQAFKKVEFAVNRKNSLREYRNLRRQCRDGRNKLQKSLYGSNMIKIRNFLINNKELQRLYQRMPIHLVVDNINQRTFAMRKECDRLRYKLDQLKKKYHKLLLERAILETRYKYENEFVLEEEIKSLEFRKKIENSNVRLKALKSINGTYKKMIHILRHDSIFYEPIIRSLSTDIKDQEQFIKYVLYLGTPAIAKSKELRDQYRQVEERTRRSLLAKIQWKTSFKTKKEDTNAKASISSATPTFRHDDGFNNLKRYVRDTDSMMLLKSELEFMENVIKQVKFVTLCSQAKEIFPRVKAQVDNNAKLRKKIENDELSRAALESKQERATMLKHVLVNNLSTEEIERLKEIKELQDKIRSVEESQTRISAEIKENSDAFVLLRVSVWNLIEILRHIDRVPRLGRVSYPEAYLQLPLLKFEMLAMRACPPEHYEQSLDELFDILKRKVIKLMSAYETELSKTELEEYADEYHQAFLNNLEFDEMKEDSEKAKQDDADDLLEENRTMHQVLNRNQIKAHSNKIVEEKSKKDEYS